MHSFIAVTQKLPARFEPAVFTLVVFFTVMASALARAFLCVGATDAFDAFFLLPPKVEADCSDNGGDDEDNDYIS
jgi:hypothetical protein